MATGEGDAEGNRNDAVAIGSCGLCFIGALAAAPGSEAMLAHRLQGPGQANPTRLAVIGSGERLKEKVYEIERSSNVYNRPVAHLTDSGSRLCS